MEEVLGEEWKPVHNLHCTCSMLTVGALLLFLSYYHLLFHALPCLQAVPVNPKVI